MEIKIEIPTSYIQERIYALERLFAYFKDINISIRSKNELNNCKIYLPNKSEITLEDHFWKDAKDIGFDFYNEQKIPSSITTLNVEINKLNFPIVKLFGEDSIQVNQNQCNCSVDLVASTFFMLTRWEEVVSSARDEHNRFPDEEALVIKNNVHQRAIVNEYIHFLKAIIEHLSHTVIEYSNSYRCFITHDVDEIFRFRPFSKWVKTLGADLVRRKNPYEVLRTLYRGSLSYFNKYKDDSYTFDYLMDVSDKYGLKSHFYFIPGYKKEPDFRYDIRSKHLDELINKINKKNHIVGIHPSYQSMESFKYFKNEVTRLNSIAPLKIKEGRHHYLRFNIGETLLFWENCNLEVDSSIGFHNHLGFRCGFCYEFPIFDLKNRITLNLKERPLIMMDVASKREVNNEDELIKKVKELKKEILKYQGDFVFLWHNNNLKHPFWRNYAKIYEKIVAEIYTS